MAFYDNFPGFAPATEGPYKGLNFFQKAGLPGARRAVQNASFFNPASHWLAPRAGTGFLQGSKIGYKVGLKGNLPFAILGGAMAAAAAPRGEAISRGVAGATSWGATAVIGGVVGTMLGGPIGGYVGSVAASLLFGETIDKAVAGTIQPLVDFGSRQRRMRFGGDYRDTQTAMTMRQAAAREMSGSLMNARQWLGQEGAFMHQ